MTLPILQIATWTFRQLYWQRFKWLMAHRLFKLAKKTNPMTSKTQIVVLILSIQFNEKTIFVIKLYKNNIHRASGKMFNFQIFTWLLIFWCTGQNWSYIARGMPTRSFWRGSVFHRILYTVTFHYFKSKKVSGKPYAKMQRWKSISSIQAPHSGLSFPPENAIW